MDECFSALTKICNSNLVNLSFDVNYSNDKLDKLFIDSSWISFLLDIYSSW